MAAKYSKIMRTRCQMKSSTWKSMIFLFLMLLLSTNVSAATYQYDDGTGEDSIGISSTAAAVWMNQFDTTSSDDYITSIEIAWGKILNNALSTIYIWDDPNNDGSPDDRVALYSTIVNIQNADTDIFNVFYKFRDVNAYRTAVYTGGIGTI